MTREQPQVASSCTDTEQHPAPSEAAEITNGKALRGRASSLQWDRQQSYALLELNAVLRRRDPDAYWPRALDLLRHLSRAEAVSLWLFPRRGGEPPLAVRVGEFTTDRLARVERWESALDAAPAEEFLPTGSEAVELGVGRRNEDLPIIHIRLFSEGILMGGASFVFTADNLIDAADYDALVETVHLVLDPGLRQRQLQITQMRLDQVSLIAQVGQQLNSTLELEAVLQDATELTAAVLDAEAATLFLADERRNELLFYTPTGEAGGRLREMRIPMNQGVAGWVATQRQSIIVNDVRSDPRFFRNVDAETGFQTKNILCVPLLAQGRLVGVLEVLNKKGGQHFTQEDKNWLESVATQAAIALENARLYQNLRMEQERIIKAQEEVREQLGRDLHDGPAQVFSLICMNVDVATNMLERGRYEMVRSELEFLKKVAEQGRRDIRTLLFELRPIILESQGLVEALRRYEQQVSGLLRSNLHMELQDLPYDLQVEAARNIFSVIQEAMNNARKHAQAQNLWVRVWTEDEVFHFQVEDDGKGFDVGRVELNYADGDSYGLLNMRDRVEVLGGTLAIHSPSPRTSRGVLIHGQAPLANILRA